MSGAVDGALYRQAVATAELVLGCVVPVMVEDNAVEAMPYFYIGTGFFVTFMDGLYLVTTRHSFKNHSVEPHQISVPRPTGGREFLSFDRRYCARINSEPVPDWADYIIVRAKAGSYTQEDLVRLRPFPITRANIIMPTSPRVLKLFLRGFPRVLNDHRYDDKVLVKKAFLFDADYRDKDSEERCYVATYQPHHDVPDPDYLSGSPVVGLVRQDDGSICVRLTGMMLRSGAKSVYVRFMGVEVLWSAFVQQAKDEGVNAG